MRKSEEKIEGKSKIDEEIFPAAIKIQPSSAKKSLKSAT